MALEARLVEFAELLRQGGVRVSPGEVEDAALALREVGLEPREVVHAALSSTLVKRSRDRETFDRVFDLFFSPSHGFAQELDRSLSRRIEEEGLLEGEERQRLVADLAKLAQGMSPFSRALLAGDGAALASLFRGAAFQFDFSRAGSSLEAGFFARRLLSAAGATGARAELEALERKLGDRGFSEGATGLVSRELSAKLRAVEEAAREYVRARAKLARKAERSPGSRPFDDLSREELERVQVAVRRLAERLRSRLVEKERSRRRGRLNVRRTLRRNMALGGVFAELVFRRKRRERPEIVVLCDVSDSVRNVARLMLLFVHTLQSRHAGVRSFAFVSDLGEITEAFREVEPSRALDRAIAGRSIHLYGNSNYGRALSIFVRDHLAAVGRRTTVLLIGDGRNNYNDPAVWALREIRRKARRVIWITPEPEEAWGTGDSEMLRYRSAVTQVLVVQSLADLEEAAKKIVSF